MIELLRTNDPVELSFTEALLASNGIPVLILDQHTSIIEGSIGAIPRRVMVEAENLARARAVIEDARQDLG